MNLTTPLQAVATFLFDLFITVKYGHATCIELETDLFKFIDHLRLCCMSRKVAKAT